MSLSAKLVAAVTAKMTNALDLQTVAAPLNQNFSTIFADGTGAGQANQMFSDRRSIGGGAVDSLDLAGSLVGPFGTTITFTKIKAIIVKADSDNPDDIIIGGAASNAFQGPFGAADDTLVLPPGGLAFLVAPDADGWSVVADTGDILDITNNDGASGANYDIVLIGTV